MDEGTKLSNKRAPKAAKKKEQENRVNRLHTDIPSSPMPAKVRRRPVHHWKSKSNLFIWIFFLQ